MARKLESYGFGVLMINRKGYPDGGKAMLEALAAARKPVIAQNQDLVALRLQPAARREDIDAWSMFGAGWSPDEGTHRWAEAREVQIRLVSMHKEPTPYVVSLKLAALAPRKVRVYAGQALLATLDLPAGGGEVELPPTRIVVPPGGGSIGLQTSSASINPGNGDPRYLSFKLSGFRVSRGQ
jgi:hypothetical protein